MPQDPARPDDRPAGAAPEAGASAPDGPSVAGAPSGNGPPPRKRKRRWAKRGGWSLGGLVGLAALVGLGVVVYLQTSAGRDFVRGRIVAELATVFADDAEVTVDGVGGNFLTGAAVTGLEVSRRGEVVLAVDTVLVDYNLTTLLRRTFSASELYVGGPRVVVRQRPDGSFDTDDLLAQREDTGGAGLTVRLDRVAVRRGAADLHWHTESGRDSVLSVRDLAAAVTGFHQSRDSLSGTIDAASLRAIAPDDAAEAAIAAEGRFSTDALVLDDLSVSSRAGTRLAGDARLLFADRGTLPVFDALVEAAPLALEDVRAFAGVEAYGDPRLRLRADSDGDLLTASLSGSLGDAAVTLDGELTRAPDGGPVHYRAEGTLRRFNPAEVLGEAAPAAEVTGDLRVDLEGTTLQTLSGGFFVALRESRLGERTIDRLRLEGEVAAGRVLFEVEGALPGAALVAEGRARPFDEVKTFQLAGVADDVDLAVLLPGSGRTDRFAGEFALVGRGASLDTFVGTAALDLSRADIGLADRRLVFSEAVVDADITRGAVAFDADLALAGGAGRVAALGTLDLGDPLAYRVTDGRAQNLNLAALTGNPSQESDLTGTFTLEGEGLDVAASPIDLTASLRDSRYGTYRVAAGELAVALRGGVATIDADLDLGPGGRVTAAGTARPFADPLAYDLEGTMRNLDLAEVQGIPERFSDLTGTYRVTGAGVDPETLSLDARLQITEPSAYGDRLVDAADLAVSLDAGALAVDGTLVTPEGAFDLALSGRPFDASPRYAFRDTRFRDLDLSDFSPGAPRTDLNGAFTGTLAGLDSLAAATGSGTLTLTDSRINEAVVERGRVAFTLDRGALGGTLDLTFGTPPADAGVPEGGRVVAAFEGRPFDEAPTYALQGRTEALDVGALLDLPPDQPVRLTTSFSVEGAGTDPKTLTLDARLAGGGSRLGPLAVDTLRADLAMADGVVRVDTLIVDTDAVDAAGAGTLALFDAEAASAFRLEGEIESLSPFAAQTERTLGLERGSFVVSAEAAPGEPLRVVGTADAEQVVLDEWAVTGLDASLAATWDRARADSLGLDALGGRLRAEAAVISGPTFRAEQATATVLADAGEFVVEAGLVVDERRELEVAARFDPFSDGVLIERGRLRLDGTTWDLLQQTEVTRTAGGVDVRGLILASPDGSRQIAADGQIDFDGEQFFVVTVENTPIDGLTDLIGLDALGGELSAELVLTGPATAPLVEGEVTLTDITSRGTPVGALRADVDYADDRVTLDAVLTHVEGETMTIAGTVPLEFTLADGPRTQDASAKAEVSLRARSRAFPIAWARPFLDAEAYTALGGTLELDLNVGGTQAKPRLDGVATLTNGRLGVAATGMVYEPIVADVSFRNERIVLDDVRILDAAGRTALDVTGEIRLRELSVGELDLTIAPRGFVAIDTRTYDRLVLRGGPRPLRLTGTLDRPVLRGSVVLAEGDIYLTDELAPAEIEPVTLTAAQIREVESRFGRVVTARDTATSRFVDALDYDLDVVIRRNVWLRSEANLPFDIEFEGTVAARKASFADESRLYGRIDLVRGTVETLNRQFELERGEIVLSGSALAADVDLAATLDVRLPGSVGGRESAVVTLTASGRLDENFSVRLSATPAMEPADIVSLIATGRLADEFVGTGALQGAAGGIAAGYLSGLAEGIASENLGLELAQIDYEGGDLVIKFGDYLSNRLFWTAGIVVPLGQTSQGEERLPVLLALDYELGRWLAAQAEYSGRRGVGGGLNVEVAW